jgi:hypothetical protein
VFLTERRNKVKVVIDRFEGDYAVCEKENREMIDIKTNRIPKEAKESDVLDIQGDKIIIDIKETEKRKKEIEELTKDLWA